MHFAETTIRFASVAFSTQQLYVGGISLATTGEGDDMIIFQQLAAAATFANATVAGEYNSLCRGGYIPALGKRNEGEQDDGK